MRWAAGSKAPVGSTTTPARLPVVEVWAASSELASRTVRSLIENPQHPVPGKISLVCSGTLLGMEIVTLGDYPSEPELGGILSTGFGGIELLDHPVHPRSRCRY